MVGKKMKLKYFKNDEFKCKCGCGKDCTPFFKEKIDKAREYAQIPFVINSGARCDEHNRAVGGKEDSSHLIGLAIDIACDTTNSLLLTRLIWSLSKVGFNRFGIAKDFIHVDIDLLKSNPAFWKY
jgi:zinc D-Ala-D-Ala carboxypeptidase